MLFTSPVMITLNVVSCVCSILILIFVAVSIIHVLKEDSKKAKKEFINGKYRNVKK